MPLYHEHQTAFNAGELAPAMLGRSDLPAYAAGLRTCQNYLVLRPGGIERRPGSTYVCELPDSEVRGRLIRFRFSEEEAYVLIFTPSGVRVIKDNALVAFASRTIQCEASVDAGTEEFEIAAVHGWPNDLVLHASIDAGGTLPGGLAASTDYSVYKPPTHTLDQATQVSDVNDTLTIPGHDLVVNMGPFWLHSTNVMCGGLDYEQDYYVESVSGDDIKLKETLAGAAVNITSQQTGTLTLYPRAEYARTKIRLKDSGGSVVSLASTGSGMLTLAPPVDTPYELSDNWRYLEADLFSIQLAQDKDALYLTRDGYPVQRLIRFNDAAWEIGDAEFEDGPYLDVAYYTPDDDRSGVTLAPAAVTGRNITVTASEPLFKGTDVGRAIRIGSDTEPQRWGWGRIVEVSGVYWTDADIVSDQIDGFDFGADEAQIIGHPFYDGEGPVRSNRYGYGLSRFTDYYVHKIDNNWVSFHLTYDDAIADQNRVNLHAVGLLLPVIMSSRINVTHGLANGDGPLSLSSTGQLPSGFSEGASYYANVIDADNLSLALTLGGPGTAPNALDGSGTHLIAGGSGGVTTCKIDILSELEAASPQEMWRLGAFSPDPLLGYPVAVTLHEQRLLLSGAAGTPQTLYASVTGRQLLFSPDEQDLSSGADDQDRIITAASAYTYKLVSEELNTVQWMLPVRALMCGDLGGIHYVTAASFGESISPTSVNAKRGTTHGAASVTPISLGSSVMFVDDSGRMLCRAQLEPSTESIEVLELMAMSDHLTDGYEIVQLARNQTPLPIIWAVSSSGELLSLTYDETQNVGAWAPHQIGGTDATVESVATLPDSQGGSVFLIVSRTVGGTTKRWVEYLTPRFTESSVDGTFIGVDGGPALYDGIATDTISGGLDHLEGETVAVVADGGYAGLFTVTGGSITIGYAANRWAIGYPYTSIAQILPPEVPSNVGQSIASRDMRLILCMLRLNRTRGLKVGRDLDHLEELDFRGIYDPMDAPPPLYSGIYRHEPNDEPGPDPTLYIVSDQGTPCQILSLLTKLEYEA